MVLKKIKKKGGRGGAASPTRVAVLPKVPIICSDDDDNNTMSSKEQRQLERLLSERLLQGYCLLEKSCPNCAAPLVKLGDGGSMEEIKNDEVKERKPTTILNEEDPSILHGETPGNPVPGVDFCVMCQAHVVNNREEEVEELLEEKQAGDNTTEKKGTIFFVTPSSSSLTGPKEHLRLLVSKKVAHPVGMAVGRSDDTEEESFSKSSSASSSSISQNNTNNTNDDGTEQLSYQKEEFEVVMIANSDSLEIQKDRYTPEKYKQRLMEQQTQNTNKQKPPRELWEIQQEQVRQVLEAQQKQQRGGKTAAATQVETPKQGIVVGVVQNSQQQSNDDDNTADDITNNSTTTGDVLKLDSSSDHTTEDDGIPPPPPIGPTKSHETAVELAIQQTESLVSVHQKNKKAATTTTTSLDFPIPEYKVRREIATKVLAARLVMGYSIRYELCGNCSMPLMEKDNVKFTDCFVCRAIRKQYLKSQQDEQQQEQKKRMKLKALAGKVVQQNNKQIQDSRPAAKEKTYFQVEGHQVSFDENMVSTKAPVVQATDADATGIQVETIVSGEPVDNQNSPTSLNEGGESLIPPSEQERRALDNEAARLLKETQKVSVSASNVTAENFMSKVPKVSIDPREAQLTKLIAMENKRIQAESKRLRHLESLRKQRERFTVQGMLGDLNSQEQRQLLVEESKLKREIEAATKVRDEAELEARRLADEKRALEESRILGELEKEASCRQKEAKEAMAKARDALDHIKAAKRKIFAKTIAEGHAQAIAEAEQAVREQAEDYHEDVISASPSDICRERWETLRSEGRSIMTRRMMSGWTILPTFCRGAECQSSPLLSNGETMQCVVCGGTGSGEDGAYALPEEAEDELRMDKDVSWKETNRAVDYDAYDSYQESKMVSPSSGRDGVDTRVVVAATSPVQTMTLKELQSEFDTKRDMVSKEIGKRMQQGWTLLDMTCPQCVMPLMTDNLKQGKICVLCGLVGKYSGSTNAPYVKTQAAQPAANEPKENSSPPASLTLNLSSKRSKKGTNTKSRRSKSTEQSTKSKPGDKTTSSSSTKRNDTDRAFKNAPSKTSTTKLSGKDEACQSKKGPSKTPQSKRSDPPTTNTTDSTTYKHGNKPRNNKSTSTLVSTSKSNPTTTTTNGPKDTVEGMRKKPSIPVSSSNDSSRMTGRKNSKAEDLKEKKEDGRSVLPWLTRKPTSDASKRSDPPSSSSSAGIDLVDTQKRPASTRARRLSPGGMSSTRCRSSSPASRGRSVGPSRSPSAVFFPESNQKQEEALEIYNVEDGSWQTFRDGVVLLGSSKDGSVQNPAEDSPLEPLVVNTEVASQRHGRAPAPSPGLSTPVYDSLLAPSLSSHSGLSSTKHIEQNSQRPSRTSVSVATARGGRLRMSSPGLSTALLPLTYSSESSVYSSASVVSPSHKHPNRNQKGFDRNRIMPETPVRSRKPGLPSYVAGNPNRSASAPRGRHPSSFQKAPSGNSVTFKPHTPPGPKSRRFIGTGPEQNSRQEEKGVIDVEPIRERRWREGRDEVIILGTRNSDDSSRDGSTKGDDSLDALLSRIEATKSQIEETDSTVQATSEFRDLVDNLARAAEEMQRMDLY